MATHYDWDGPLMLGSNHLAAGLTQAGWDVARIATAISPVQILQDPDRFAARARRYSRSGRTHLEGHLWTYTPWSLATPHNKPLLSSRWLHRNWQRLTIPNVVRSVRSKGFGAVDLLYVDHPSQTFWLDSVTHDVSVARIVDRYEGFSRAAPELIRQERDLVRSVDVSVHVSHVLGPHLTGIGARRTFYLPNGVDFAHFADGDRTVPEELAALDGPVALYVGEMASWFDYDTVNELTVRLPHVNFVLVGPDRMARKRLREAPNLHLLGPRPFSEVPRYMHNANVGLILQDIIREPERTNAVHPLKLYEYLACGLPVVATKWDEIGRLGSPAALCENPAEFAAAIESALERRPDPAPGIEFARRADWSQRVASLIALVREISHERTGPRSGIAS